MSRPSHPPPARPSVRDTPTPPPRKRARLTPPQYPLTTLPFDYAYFHLPSSQMSYSHPYPTHLYSRYLYHQKRLCPMLNPYVPINPYVVSNVPPNPHMSQVSVPVLHPPVESAPITQLPISDPPRSAPHLNKHNTLQSLSLPHHHHHHHQRLHHHPPHHHAQPHHHTQPHPHSQTQTDETDAQQNPHHVIQHHPPPPRPPPPPLPPYALPMHDDADGHLIYNLGDGLHPTPHFPNGRYKILSQLGEGTFGKVVECWDRMHAHRVAIKVVRSVTKYRQAAKLEIDVLLHLNMNDPHRLYHCVTLYSWFDYRSHVCMVFEKLGPSLYDSLRSNRFRPFPLKQVRAYAFQLLESINFVHSLTLIHTDLKPENILLRSNDPSTTAITLIDFGSATFQSHHHSAVISTRHYRAPEVILGLGWTYTCDLWSIGCILVELYTGQALFQTHENLEHLAMMSGVLGPIPDSMIRRADGSGQKYFTRRKGGRKALNWPGGASSKASIRSVRRVQALKDMICGPDAHSAFLDLVRSLLVFDPDARCTSAQALQHPFFRDYAQDSDQPLTTPTLSSASSACGSQRRCRNQSAARAAKRQRRAHTRRTQKPHLPHHMSHLQRVQKSDGGAIESASDVVSIAEHSDRTIVEAQSPKDLAIVPTVADTVDVVSGGDVSTGNGVDVVESASTKKCVSS